MYTHSHVYIYERKIAGRDEVKGGDENLIIVGTFIRFRFAVAVKSFDADTRPTRPLPGYRTAFLHIIRRQTATRKHVFFK